MVISLNIIYIGNQMTFPLNRFSCSHLFMTPWTSIFYQAFAPSNKLTASLGIKQTCLSSPDVYRERIEFILTIW